MNGASWNSSWLLGENSLLQLRVVVGEHVDMEPFGHWLMAHLSGQYITYIQTEQRIIHVYGYMYEGKYEYINIYTLYVYTCFSLILEALSVMYSLLGDKKQLLWEFLSFIKST